MRPDFIERTDIKFPSSEDRFSTEPVTKPVSGKPSPPPTEDNHIAVSGRKLKAPFILVGQQLPTTQEKRKPGRPEKTIPKCTNLRGHDMRGDGIEPHSGKRKVRCAHCKAKRYATAAELRRLVLVSRGKS